MRLIGTIETEKKAFEFYSFLLKEGISNIYEAGSAKEYRIWVYDENDLDIAIHWMKLYLENPNDPRFQILDSSSTIPPPQKYEQIAQAEDLKWQSVSSASLKIHRFSVTITHLIIALCIVLFLWNDFEEEKILEKSGPVGIQIALTPIMQSLLFDYPSSYKYVEKLLDQFPVNTYKEQKDFPPEAVALINQANQVPTWNGLYHYFSRSKTTSQSSILLFEKIRQGQYWRLFTPCLLHRDFLHILFNMAWVWILCKQIEVRMPVWKMGCLILILGSVSNIAQYLMSGPYFLGFSGVVVGMAGFIWIRQKIAPWEGYPLQKSTAIFLLFFVMAMFGLELLTFALQWLSLIKISPNIANTAHVVGGLSGMFLGRLSFFGRSRL